ncbi:MAG TPA: beta-galactosidase [Candidatus Udaeobacter sp.]|nr:beta-galactosidase [Candidatus Udaeobacter sp.]
MIYGVSFNPEYGNYLGLDTKKSFLKIVDNWNFKYIRLSAQWDLIEKEKGKYDWTELDWLMNEAAKKNVKIVLAVGNKTPRWPECHPPAWIIKNSYAGRREPLFAFMASVVNRYKKHPALEIWQVENEPFVNFGDCLPLSQKELMEEVNFVKGLDPNHKTLVTDSGELSFWFNSAKAGDLFGTTLYRVVWNKYFGYFNYDWLMPPLTYIAKLWLNGRHIDTAYVMELQGEPWIPDRPLTDTSLNEQFKSMSLQRFKDNVDFAARTGMPRAYLWGAEWWLWLENQNVHNFSDYIKTLNKE